MKPSVLYLSYTGLLEPLGRSQVLAYLKHLAAEYAITLVTFEKERDLANERAVAAAREECARSSIQWAPRRYHHKPRLLATLYDVIEMTALAVRHHARSGTRLVHSRGYVTTLAAWLASRVTGVPFVFDMRALWIDEMILARRLQEGSTLERALRRMERMLLRDATTVVSLTEAAVTHLKGHTPELAEQRFEVIPTCVEIDRFSSDGAEEASTGTVLGSVGTIASGWVPISTLIGLYGALLTLDPTTRLRVVTRDDPSPIYAELNRQGLPIERVSVKACEPGEVPSEMRGITAGFCVFDGGGVGKLGSMPTRIGEFLAAGVPVIGNKGVGDVADLIARYGVGVALEHHEPELQAAAEKIVQLASEPEIGSRCRAAAEQYFSSQRGVRAYAAIWRRIIAAGANCTAKSQAPARPAS